MKIILNECVHCGDIYNYQASGWSCHEETNDDKHCPVCKQVLIDALKTIPVKFEYRWIECIDLTKEKALEIIELDDEEFEKKQIQNNNNTSGIPISLLVRRVYPCLTNLKTGESSNERGFKHNGFNYYISYWNSRPNDYSIRKEVRWNLELDKEQNLDYGYRRNK